MVRLQRAVPLSRASHTCPLSIGDRPAPVPHRSKRPRLIRGWLIRWRRRLSAARSSPALARSSASRWAPPTTDGSLQHAVRDESGIQINVCCRERAPHTPGGIHGISRDTLGPTCPDVGRRPGLSGCLDVFGELRACQVQRGARPFSRSASNLPMFHVKLSFLQAGRVAAAEDTRPESYSRARQYPPFA